MIPPALSYTAEESDNASRLYGANCGPHSLAAAAGVDLMTAMEAILDFKKKRYTNPTMMEFGLRHLKQRFVCTKYLHLKTLPLKGVARIQWEGTWLRSGVPSIVAYAYTHWVASNGDYVVCTACPWFGWIPYEQWVCGMDSICGAQRYDGWHVTHQYLFL